MGVENSKRLLVLGEKSVRLPGESVSKELIEAVGWLREKEVLVSLASLWPAMLSMTELGNGRDDWDRLVSREAWFPVENGGRLVDFAGETRESFGMNNREIDAVIDALPLSMVEYLMYMPTNLEEKLTAWAPMPKGLQRARDMFGKLENFKTARNPDLESLRKRLMQVKPSQIMLKMKQSGVELEVGTEFGVSTRGEYVMLNSKNASLGRAVEEMASQLQIDLSDVWVIGGSENEMTMFGLPGVRGYYTHENDAWMYGLGQMVDPGRSAPVESPYRLAELLRDGTLLTELGAEAE